MEENNFEDKIPEATDENEGEPVGSTEESSQEHTTIGKAFINFVRDEVIVRKKYASFLIWGKPGMGKTVSAVKLCMMLDPTFIPDFENRYIIGDQYDKLFEFLKKAAQDKEKYYGKAYLWDEIGIGARSEEHAKKEQIRITNVYQMVRYTGTILVGTLTWAALLNKALKSHIRYIIEIQSKDTNNKINFGRLTEVEYAQKYVGGELKNDLREHYPIIPEEYTKGTEDEGSSVELPHLDFRLPRKHILELIEKYENAWKTPYIERMQRETTGLNYRGDPTFYEKIAQKIMDSPETFIIKKARTEQLDKEKLMNVFGLTNKEIKQVFEKLRLTALDKGKLDFAEKLRI